ncbi:hypothetical protein [Pseudomonas sp.]|uniref:hypothetical protein n=1 Tax=Pseudomonas sp. TaxID=306 RepID=UPI0028A856D6|nr:hypothetical protein [Pseudomonas sp.]
MRNFSVALSVALLAGCATSAMPVSKATPVPSDELYGFQAELGADSGKLTVVRDTGAAGSGCDVVVYIDGKKAAKVGTGQRASFHVPAGQPNLGVGLADTGLCGGMAIRSITANVQRGAESIYRISGDMSGIFIGPYINYE